MSSITFTHYVNGALENAFQVKLKDATNTFAIKNGYTNVIMVTPTAALTPSSIGVYTYDVGVLEAGSYEAVWEIIHPYVGSTPQYVIQNFSIDTPTVVPRGTRLMDIERRVAERIATTRVEYAGVGSSELFVVIPGIKSSQQLVGLQDYYMLRRGMYRNGNFVVGFTADDRVRRAVTYNNLSGTIIPDRAYTLPPVEGETIEFVYIHPDTMRSAVLAGLKRCHVMDTVDITSLAVGYGFDLTALVPWIQRTSQVKRVRAGGQGIYRPLDLHWMSPVYRQGSVTLEALRYPATSSLTITALRPVDTYVNGHTNMNGPNSDDDVMFVDLSYAAAAGHIELWRVARPYLMAASQVGYQTTQKEAAQEFTKQAQRCMPKEPEFVRFNSPFGYREPQQP